MLNETLAKLLKESYETGDKLAKDYEELTEALEKNAIPPEEIIDRVGRLSLAYNEWRIRHEMLISLGYETSDTLIEEQLRKLVEGGA